MSGQLTKSRADGSLGITRDNAAPAGPAGARQSELAHTVLVTCSSSWPAGSLDVPE